MAYVNEAPQAMSEPNIVPLIDILLVLLIIFMISAPSVTFQVPIDLPQKSLNPPVRQDPPPPIALKIRATGQLFWNEQPLVPAALEPQLQLEARKDPQPELRIDADNETEYQVLADVLATARRAGMTKIGFENMPGT